MGQIVNVVERPSSRAGIVRFETDRSLSGMGHDRYVAGQPIEDDRPVDELARRIFARGGVQAVHINGSVITVDLESGFGPDGIADIVRGLYTFYVATPLESAAEGAGLERPADPGAQVAARNEALAAEHEATAPDDGPDAAEETDTPKQAAEPKGGDEPLEADTEGHGEVAADPADAPNEAEGTVRPADTKE